MNIAVYQKRLEKSSACFRSIKIPQTKEIAGSKSHIAKVDKALTAAINIWLAGLAEDLTAIKKSNAPQKVLDAKIHQAHEKSSGGIRRVFGMRAEKLKTAGWIVSALSSDVKV